MVVSDVCAKPLSVCAAPPKRALSLCATWLQPAPPWPSCAASSLAALVSSLLSGAASLLPELPSCAASLLLAPPSCTCAASPQPALPSCEASSQLAPSSCAALLQPAPSSCAAPRLLEPTSCATSLLLTLCAVELNPALCAVELNPALCSVVLNPALCSVALCAVELNPALCSVALNPALCAIAFDSVSSLRFEEESPVPSQEAPLTSHEALLPFQEAPLPVKEAPLPFKKAPMSYMALIYRTTVTMGLVVTFSSHRLLIGDMASPPALNRCGPAILQQLSFVHVLYVTTLAALAVYSAINPWSCDLMLMPHNSHHVGGLLRLLALQCAASSPVVWPHNSHHVGDFVAVSYSSHQLLIGDMASPAWNRFQSQPVAVTGGAVDVLLPEGALTDGGAASPGGVSAPGSPDLRFVASRHLSVANDAVPVASPAVVPASPYVAISENSLFDAYDPDQNWDATNGLDTSASSEYFDGDDPDLQSWFPSQLTSDRSSPQPSSSTLRMKSFTLLCIAMIMLIPGPGLITAMLCLLPLILHLACRMLTVVMQWWRKHW